MAGRSSRSIAGRRVAMALTAGSAIVLTVFNALKVWSERTRWDAQAPCPTPGCRDAAMVDFRDTIWLPTKWLLAGGDPYDGAAYAAQFPFAQDFPTYAPGHLAVWLPFGALPWQIAVSLAVMVNAAVVVAVGAWAGVRCLQQWRAPAPVDRAERITAAAAGVTVLWLARTVADAVGYGQPSVLYGLLAAPALLVRRPSVAVLCTAVTCLKPHIGVFVVITLLAQKRWRTAAFGATLAGGVSLAVAVWAAGGPSGLIPWLHTLAGNAGGSSARRAVEYLGERIDVVGSALDHGLSVGGWATVAGLAAGVIAMVVAVRAAERLGLPLIGVVSALSIALLAFYHISYDAMWLLAPTALAGTAVCKAGDRDVRRAMLPGLAALGIAAFAARWHPIDVVVGPGTTIAVMRILLLLGTAALALGLWRIGRRPSDLGSTEWTPRTRARWTPRYFVSR